MTLFDAVIFIIIGIVGLVAMIPIIMHGPDGHGQLWWREKDEHEQIP